MIYAMDRVSATTLASRITESFLSVTGKHVTHLFRGNGLKDIDYPHGVKITWGRPLDTVTQWDKVSIWGIETFGLPGDRYITDININEMIWWFKDPCDQTLFTLRNGSAQCIRLQYQT